MEYPRASALEIAAAVAAGEASPVEMVEAAFARMDAVNEPVNAIVWRREEAARADAAAATERLARGEPPRLFEGVPFTTKDLCAIADGPIHLGSRAFENTRARVDQYIVRRLKAAGGILVATTTSPELGARPTCENDLYGATRNPWDLSRTSGGSSGGAGVSAALGMAPLNQGSDGGGSIRTPAALCGVFGLKPQRARITMGPVLGEGWGGLSVYGPLTRTVADAAAFLDATAGPGPGDPYWAPPPAATFLSATDEERPLKIAFAIERDGEKIDPACADAVRATAELLAQLGHEVVEDAPEILPMERSFVTVSSVGIAATPMTDEQIELLEPRNKRIVAAARSIGAVDYGRAIASMQRHARAIATFFEDVDILLTPTMSRPAPPLGEIGANDVTAWEDSYRNFLCWTWPFNATGQPAANIPAGASPDGLPVGVQLVGRAADERTVLMLAAQLERARPWRDHVPPLW